MIGNYVPIIWKNAVRNARRSVLTVAAISISLCLLAVLGAVYRAFTVQQETPEQALRLITRNRISLASFMPISYKQQILSIPGVEQVVGAQWFQGIYKDPANTFARMAIEPEHLFTVCPDYKIPLEQKDAFQREKTACILHKSIAQKYDIHLGDRITLIGDIFPGTYELVVRGIYDGSNTEALYFHLDYLYQKLPKARRNYVGTFTVLAESADVVPRIAHDIDLRFRNSPIQTRTESESAFQLGFLAMLGNWKMFLLSICAAVTFTILLVCANTMAMAVRERMRELGVLKAVGFSNQVILSMILAEAACLSLLGGIAGCIIAAMLAFLVRQRADMVSQLRELSLQPLTAATVVTVGIVVGMVSALLPAWSASKTPILELLKFRD